MDHESAQRWLDRYVDAWLSYARDDVAALFSADVVYRYHPYDEPILGRDAVVASWLGESGSGGASTRDEPGTYEAKYFPVAVDGDIVVAIGTSRYREVAGGPVVRTYENCFVVRFDGARDGGVSSPSTTCPTRERQGNLVLPAGGTPDTEHRSACPT